jgi:hypothetical protein
LSIFTGLIVMPWSGAMLVAMYCSRFSAAMSVLQVATSSLVPNGLSWLANVA